MARTQRRRAKAIPSWIEPPRSPVDRTHVGFPWQDAGLVPVMSTKPAPPTIKPRDATANHGKRSFLPSEKGDAVVLDDGGRAGSGTPCGIATIYLTEPDRGTELCLGEGFNSEWEKV